MRFVEFLPFVSIRLSPFFYDLPSSGYAFNEQTKIQKIKNTYFDSTSFLDSLQFIHFFFLFCFVTIEKHTGAKLENTNGARFVENKNTLFPAGARASRPGNITNNRPIFR